MNPTKNDPTSQPKQTQAEKDAVAKQKSDATKKNLDGTAEEEKEAASQNRQTNR